MYLDTKRKLEPKWLRYHFLLKEFYILLTHFLYMILEELIQYKHNILSEIILYQSIRSLSKNINTVFLYILDTQLYAIIPIKSNIYINNYTFTNILDNILNKIIIVKLNNINNNDVEILTKLDYIIDLLYMNTSTKVDIALIYINKIINSILL
jgi:hypothetical protein